MSARLQWDAGVGFLPVSESPYDAAYFDKYRRYADTEMGRAITQARVDLVRRHMGGGTVCDVGIGCGAFVEAAQCAGYDINPAGVAWLNERAAYRDPYAQDFDALTFWDALEHIPDVALMLTNARRWVFASLPIVPGDGPPNVGWKHWRKDEHCWYFTAAGFIRWMSGHGFDLVEANRAETALGREDIMSFALERRVLPV